MAKNRKQNARPNNHQYSSSSSGSSTVFPMNDNTVNDPNIEIIPSNLPKLIVFDLDNTLWTPELYQVRTKNNITPKIGTDIRLFPDAQAIVADFATSSSFDDVLHSKSSRFQKGRRGKIGRGEGGIWKNSQFAIASRTHQTEWAYDLLQTFEAIPGVPLTKLFPPHLCQIVPGSKRTHFQKLQEASQIAFEDMIFFDDDAHLNLREIEQMGVFCCHCPRGINMDLFRRALWKYSELKEEKTWMGVTVNARSLPKR